MSPTVLASHLMLRALLEAESLFTQIVLSINLMYREALIYNVYVY